MKLHLTTLFIALTIGLYSQQLSWDLTIDGTGVSNHQELTCLDFTAGSGVTSFTFSTTGAYAKSWNSPNLDIEDYFQTGFSSTAQDTFELNTIQFSERRSSTGIHTYEIRYSDQADFSTYISLGTVNVPDNDAERDTSIENLEILILPGSTFYMRWYGYAAESSAGSWRINDGSLNMVLSTYIPDVTPPVLNHAEVIDTKTIELNFNEALDASSYQISDFLLDGSINPITIDNSQVTQGIVKLEFANNLPIDQTMNLRYQNIKDTEGNTIIGELFVDLFFQATPPTLIDAEILSQFIIQMNFDQAIDSNSFSISDFTINPNTNPTSVDKSQSNLGVIKLHFANEFTEGETMTLKYKNIADEEGNIMIGEKEIQLAFYIPKAFCLIIDELMTDPTPTVYLPESEYVEIYNSKPFPINLKNWTLQNGSSTYTFPATQINANSYLLIVPQGDKELYSPNIDIVEMNFGTIVNSKSNLTLFSQNGTWIHQVNYLSDWHSDSYKKDGGWSIEMKDKNQACNMSNNWSSSVNNLGGTPGFVNSVDGQTSTNPTLDIESVYFSDTNKVILLLNKMLSPTYLPNTTAFEINQENPISYTYEIGLNEIAIEFTNAFDTNIVYQLKISDTLWTCNGSYLEIPTTKRLAFPVSVDSNDIIINEILFNPTSDGEKYIEFYNRTDKILDLQEMKLAIWDEGEINPKDFISETPLIIYPHEYFVLTKDKELVANQKNIEHTDRIFNTDQFITMSTTKDRIYLLNKGDRIIDEVYYNETFHKQTLSTFDGVALEKTNPDDIGLCPLSWHSASEESGYGTPTSSNSQVAVNDDNLEFDLANAYFTDTTSIKLKFNKLLAVDYQPKSNHFIIDQRHPDSIIHIAGHNSIQLFFANSFTENTEYEIKITDSIFTCGNDLLEIPSSFRIGIPLKVDSNDLVINEIFFNPIGKNKTFLECYNQSNKIIDLSEIKLGLLDDDEIAPKGVISDEPTIVFPKDYFVVTKDKTNITEQFYVKYPNKLFETEQIPSLSSSEDYVFILDRGDKIIDEAHYTEDYHNPILATNEGVSLEKINPKSSGLNTSVWQSASQTSGFGTPTYVNSQFSEIGIEGNDNISFESETFSPDMDGYHDYLIINYQLKKSGYAANVKIYNSKGQFILDLVTNEYTGKQGQWTWDGRDINGDSSPLGIYIIIFEFIHSDGELIQNKKVCTIAGML